MNFSKRVSVVGIFISLFLLYLTPVFSENEINSASSVLLEIDHSISFTLKENKDSLFNYLDLYSYYLPQTLGDHQSLNSYTSTSESEISFVKNRDVESIKYSYSNPPSDNHADFSTLFVVESIPNYPKITEFQHFPYLAEEVANFSTYLEFTEQINTNSALENKAFELAYGENDTYIIATKIANWLQEEIEYDLSTVFANPDQKATEIYESKRGVCKELSIIYSSMLRSLNIPTRMVMGYAYTNSDEIIDLVGSNWGGHAWVEVYINGQWVPFDLTYQQYGYVDSSHIVFQYTPDISQLGVQMEMSAFNFRIKEGSLTSKFDFKVQNIGEEFSPIRIDSKLTSEYSRVKPLSEIKLSAMITNTENYYQSFPIELVYPKEVENLSSKELIVSLKPYEKKIIDFYVRTPDLSGYIFPFSIFSQSLEFANYSVSLDDLEDLIIETQYEEKTQIPELIDSNYLDVDENSDLENVSYSCLFSSQMGTLVTTCEISNVLEFESISLCSSVDCSAIEGNSDDSISLTVESKIGSRYTLILDEDLKNLHVDLEYPEFKYSYEINDNVLYLKSLVEDKNNLEYMILFETGAYNVNVTQNSLNNSIQLPEGKFSGVVHFYYMGESIETKQISFEIENKNIFSRIIKLFQSLF